MSGHMLPFKNNPNSVHFPSGQNLLASQGLVNLPDVQRVQMMEFSQRLRAFGLPYGAGNPPQVHSRLLQVDPLFYLYGRQDPRLGFFLEEPKPSHSYIGLIAMGILSAKDKKLVLSDIYQWILDNYPYFRTRGPGWRNSIRHNLSLNDCFIKSGRAANGKGHYWAIHPAVISDFEKGDFRRRRAQRKVRKAMGLAVPDDEDDAGSPPPPCSADVVEWRARMAQLCQGENPRQSVPKEPSPPPSSDEKEKANNTDNQQIVNNSALRINQDSVPLRPFPAFSMGHMASLQWKNLYPHPMMHMSRFAMNPALLFPHASPQAKISPSQSRKRSFDVESLLAPDIKKSREDISDTESERNLNHANDNDASVKNRQEKLCNGSGLGGADDSDIDVEEDAVLIGT